MGAQPCIDVGGLNLISNTVAESSKDDIHSALEIPNIFAVMALILADRLLGHNSESNAFVLHVLRNFTPRRASDLRKA
jgi:hypothetical protein